jgi:hypothetical protein
LWKNNTKSALYTMQIQNSFTLFEKWSNMSFMSSRFYSSRAMVVSRKAFFGLKVVMMSLIIMSVGLLPYNNKVIDISTINSLQTIRMTKGRRDHN